MSLRSLLLVGLLAGCGATQEQQITMVRGAQTLAAVAAANNTTVADVLAKGALVCGKAATAKGVLVQGAVVILANAANVPVSVLDMAQADVAQACKAVGLVPGALPPSADPERVLVKVAPTVLPPVALVAT